MSGSGVAAAHGHLHEIVRMQFSTMLNDEEDPVIRHLIQNDDTFSVKTYLFLKKDDTDVRKYEVGLHLLRAVSDFHYQQILRSMCTCVASSREFDTEYTDPGDGQQANSDSGGENESSGEGI